MMNKKKILKKRSILQIAEYSLRQSHLPDFHYYPGGGGMIIMGSLPSPSPPRMHLIDCRLSVSFSVKTENRSFSFRSGFAADTGTFFMIITD